MAKKPGRPSSDEIATESVRQANDASKIDVQTDDNETARLLKEANAILTHSAKTDLLKAAATNAKKAVIWQGNIPAEQKHIYCLNEDVCCLSKQCLLGTKGKTGSIPNPLFHEKRKQKKTALPLRITQHAI